MTQRDWQKDMEIADQLKLWKVDPGGEEDGAAFYTIDANGIHTTVHADNMLGTDAVLLHESLVSLSYWLQEAKERGEREQQLKEEIEASIPLIEAAGLKGRAASLKSLLDTLYPDTPAPKEGE